jgi:shikimate dehydrogenase
MQNAGLAALGLNWRYLAFEVHPKNLASALAGAEAMRFVGLNLTVPHKLLAMEWVDVLDDSAKTWGAVNTIRFEARNEKDGWRPLREFEDTPEEIRSVGFNTDAEAITQSLSEDLGLDLSESRVLLLGAGGAGRTAALKLASFRVKELFLVNRTRSKAEALAKEIQQNKPELKLALGYPSGPVDLVLNATSLGLRTDDELPFDEQQFSLKLAGAVYDMIYRPAETRLLTMAKTAGCRTANGVGMLLHQGARALEIWTGQRAPIEIMRRALVQNIYG